MDSKTSKLEYIIQFGYVCKDVASLVSSTRTTDWSKQWQWEYLCFVYTLYTLYLPYLPSYECYIYGRIH